jgi:hypothetical protein
MLVLYITVRQNQNKETLRILRNSAYPLRIILHIRRQLEHNSLWLLNVEYLQMRSIILKV